MHSDQHPLILLIGRRAETLAALRATLEMAGYACFACATAQAARDFARSAVPDLIVCDMAIEGEGEGGVELCDDLRGRWLGREIPVMLLSSAQTPDIIRRSNVRGPRYYLRKPLDGAVLRELVDNLLGLPQLAGHLDTDLSLGMPSSAATA